MLDDYWFRLAKFEAMKRRIEAGDDLIDRQLAKSYALLRASYQLLKKPEPDRSQGDAGE
ncbi:MULTISPECIES: hypothetical protein [Bradyrhizobium]|uniref:hypothetical protein n=1 Tax=Bradyrhizobium TaxID=374 RepID=UPI0004B3CE7A|nr:hypothetical protein [Bradyrhizobium elkanii]MBP2433986.1 hypothetical protein [Bradyrhizobium elkanii]WLA85746.1 hypothetical protein QNJ99_16895 [Bradyrhizobium elkanii]WLA89058.1 hypothetical protein QNJ96_28775 [Bradyrhizobium elkanii]